MFNKYRRTLLWIGGSLILYSLLGFFFVPWIAERMMLQILNERLSLNTQVESIYFNPFTFYAQIEQLTISDRVDANNPELLSLGNLHANFQASRLFALKLQFSQLAIRDLDVHVKRDSQANVNVSQLAQRWAETAAPVPEDAVVEVDAESGLVPLEITTLDIANLTLHLEDQVPATPFSTSATLTAATVQNISTLIDSIGSNAVVIQLEEDAQLSWNGEFSISPLRLTGNIDLDNLGLSAVSRYLQDSVPVSVQDGRLAVGFAYSADLSQDEPVFTIDNLMVELTELDILQHNETSPFLHSDSLLISGGTISIPQNQARIEAVTLSGFDIALLRNSAGEINLQTMLDEFSDTTDSTNTPPATATNTPTSNSEPWAFVVDALTIADARISIDDQSLEQPFSLAMVLNTSITDISNQDQAEFPITLDLAFDSGGTIQMAGELQVFPELDLSSSLSIDTLNLLPTQAYINEFAFVDLQQGSVSVNARIASNANDIFSYQGDLSLQQIIVADQQRNETLLSMGMLSIDQMNFSLTENALEISELAFESLFARVIINEDGSTNIGASIKSESGPPPVETENVPETETSNSMGISVGRIRIDNGSANFTDLNLPIVFNAKIQSLSGSAEGFATNSAQPVAIKLEGEVDEFGLVQIDTSLNPFDILQKTRIDLAFSNLDVPAMTPYVIKFAGREIDEGRLDVDLSYAVSEGELIASNQLVLRDLSLGERVDYPDAMDLPLDMAIALLKDGNGVIDLEIPVTGNVNNPEFSLGPVIRRAISNILTGIVAAPFRLLGNLIPGGDDNGLDRIKFLPGRVDIAAPERQVLEQLQEALAQRPQLSLLVPPLSGGEADLMVLRSEAVVGKINALLEQDINADAQLLERRRLAVESLYTQGGLSPSIEEVQQLHQVGTDSTNPVTGAVSTSFALDPLAYVADLQDRLVAAEPIGESELTALASERMNAVIQYLTANGEMDPQRILKAAPQAGELDDDGWLVMEFDLKNR